MEEKHIFISGNYNVSERISSDKRIKRNKAKRKRGFFVLALALFSLSLAALCATIIYLDSNRIIPDGLFGKVIWGLLAFSVFELFFLIGSRKSIIMSILSSLVCLAVITSSAIGTYAVFNVYKSVEAVEAPKEFFAHVGVYVKKDSDLAPSTLTSEDGGEPEAIPGRSLDGCSIGTILKNLDKGYTSQAVRILRKDADVSIIVYNDFNSLLEALRNDEIDAIVCNEAFLDSYVAENNDFFVWAVEAKSIGIETEHIINTVKSDVISEPFLVYISGLDTSKIDYFPDAARCDGNIIAAIDPIDKSILLVSIPRDYYLPLWGDDSAMDKLTHAGIFGVECSMDTLEALFDIEFSFYVRFNVYSVVKIVDALGGITVHSDYDFSTKNIDDSIQYFHVGENEIDGLGAIAFVRERNSFANGDRQRGIHQQECIKAIIEKACSPAIVTRFSDVLNVIEDSIRTNIGQEEINSLIRMQISDMATWTIESISVDGYGSSEPCYAMGGEVLYTMIPYYETVDAAKEKLFEIMNY